MYRLFALRNRYIVYISGRRNINIKTYLSGYHNVATCKEKSHNVKDFLWKR